MDVKMIFIIIAVVFLVAIYFKLCNLLDEIRHIKSLIHDLNKHVIGNSDDPDSTMIKHSLKELIVNRCLEIENEIVKIRYGVFGGERSPAIDNVNVLDTLIDIKEVIKKELK